MSSAGPTILLIDFNRLDSSANRLADVGDSAQHAGKTMASASLGPLAFGSMNAPLGATVSLVANHARDLTEQLADVASHVATNAQAASRSWRQVEDEAAATLVELQKLLADGVAG